KRSSYAPVAAGFSRRLRGATAPVHSPRGQRPMKRLACVIVLPLVLLVVPVFAADAGSQEASKEALKALNDFIGDWKGSGAPVKATRPAASEVWTETVSWSWRFKGDDAWLTVTFKDGRHFKAGELRYLPDKKRYQLTLTDKKDKKQVF